VLGVLFALNPAATLCPDQEFFLSRNLRCAVRGAAVGACDVQNNRANLVVFSLKQRAR
jgi:hypothetical protein